jgi:flagellar assembly factor FliW
MKIETSRFGSVEIEEEQIFTFPMGILGFARCKQFVVIDHTEDSPFKWLQSLDEGGLAFIITDPLFFRADYHIKMRRTELSMLEPISEDDLVVSVIMTIPENPQDMSANLMAPVIFNMANRVGMQHVLTKSQYPVKYYALRKKDQSEVDVAVAAENTKAISLS